VEANQMTGLVEERQEDLQATPHRSRRADMQATPRQASNKRTRQPSPDSLASSLSKVTRRSTSHSTAVSSRSVSHASAPLTTPSRSVSPTHDLQGASRITGGTSRGRALGNVFNMGDKGM
jgi:hypothetical protein